MNGRKTLSLVGFLRYQFAAARATRSFRAVPAICIALLLSGAGYSQTLTIGRLPPSSDYSFSQNSLNGFVAVLDYGNPSEFDGLLESVTFRWSNAPCPAAVSIGTYREEDLSHGFARISLVAERGPFDVTSLTQTVTLAQPIPVLLGDRIAIRNATTCGAPTGLSNTTTPLASVLGGSSFPLGFSFGRPIQSIPIQVAVRGIGTVNASVIPVVISATGQNSSVFRTSLQLYNPAGSSAAAIGRLVFWGDTGQPIGIPLSSAASLAYSIAPGKILSIPDLLAAVGLSGLFSVDVIVDSGPSPVGVARIFNDQGDAGTAGFTEDLLNESSSLGAGDTGVLIAPADAVNFRFNVGIRTLAAAKYTVTIRDSSGNVRATRDSGRSSEFISQDPASHFPDFCCGVPIGASDTITIEVKSGRVFLYGATADNRTNDSSFQLARRVSSLQPTPN